MEPHSESRVGGVEGRGRGEDAFLGVSVSRVSDILLIGTVGGEEIVVVGGGGGDKDMDLMSPCDEKGVVSEARGKYVRCSSSCRFASAFLSSPLSPPSPWRRTQWPRI